MQVAAKVDPCPWADLTKLHDLAAVIGHRSGTSRSHTVLRILVFLFFPWRMKAFEELWLDRFLHTKLEAN
jgi:hypothetical protein